MIKKYILLFLIIATTAQAGVWWKLNVPVYDCSYQCSQTEYKPGNYYDTGYYYPGENVCWCYEQNPVIKDCQTYCSGYDTYYCYGSDNWCQFLDPSVCSGDYKWFNCNFGGEKDECPGGTPFCYCLDYEWDQGCHDQGGAGPGE